MNCLFGLVINTKIINSVDNEILKKLRRMIIDNSDLLWLNVWFVQSKFHYRYFHVCNV